MEITIPENISSRLRKLAARRRLSVEELVTDRLFTSLDEELDLLSSDEQAELRALHHLSNDALRVIASEQMSENNQDRLNELMERHSFGQLLAEELPMLESLVERGDRLMLRKAEAAAILVSRNSA